MLRVRFAHFFLSLSAAVFALEAKSELVVGSSTAIQMKNRLDALSKRILATGCSVETESFSDSITVLDIFTKGQDMIQQKKVLRAVSKGNAHEFIWTPIACFEEETNNLPPYFSSHLSDFEELHPFHDIPFYLNERTGIYDYPNYEGGIYLLVSADSDCLRFMGKTFDYETEMDTFLQIVKEWHSFRASEFIPVLKKGKHLEDEITCSFVSQGKTKRTVVLKFPKRRFFVDKEIFTKETRVYVTASSELKSGRFILLMSKLQEIWEFPFIELFDERPDGDV